MEGAPGYFDLVSLHKMHRPYMPQLVLSWEPNDAGVFTHLRYCDGWLLDLGPLNIVLDLTWKKSHNNDKYKSMISHPELPHNYVC